ncbi:hypothetical protein [Calothrix sp. PCC 7507]|uniref:hypothetical protein n=1 Tax=Calothrix sp. PCC 7507 TaxID=99598 RepID=UPI00029F2C53|nr:hypothetical protein [Calothrix sp. PCC 7507]AFY31607.1 hypothetical protein Cal7507_1133 [Calothrix sp. PCC 7507]
MGRRKSARQIERDLAYAKAREAYNPPLREEGAATQRRPKIAVKYAVLSPLAATDSAFTIQASSSGIQFFGGIAALGLAAQGTDPSEPRGFRPAQVRAMVADSSPAVVRAKGSNRPYVRYGKGTRDSNSQYNYSAPVTAETPAALDTRVKAIFTAIKPSLGGGYGRVWFEAELYPLSSSG